MVRTGFGGASAVDDGHLGFAGLLLGLGEIEQCSDMERFEADGVLPGDASLAAALVGPERVTVCEMRFGDGRADGDGTLEQAAGLGGAAAAEGDDAGEKQRLGLIGLERQDGGKARGGFGQTARRLVGDSAEQERDESGG